MVNALLNYSAGMYLFKVNKGNNGTIVRNLLNLFNQWRISDVFIISFEQVSDIVLMFWLIVQEKQKQSSRGVL